MIKEIKGNAVDYTLASPNRVMIHCTNAQRVMGAGIAKEVKEKCPRSYKEYLDDCALGAITGRTTQVVNLTAQEFYGRSKKRYVNYGALASCLSDVKYCVNANNKELVVPKYMACGLAGGDWEIVLEMILYYLEEEFKQITIVEL